MKDFRTRHPNFPNNLNMACYPFFVKRSTCLGSYAGESHAATIIRYPSLVRYGEFGTR